MTPQKPSRTVFRHDKERTGISIRTRPETVKKVLGKIGRAVKRFWREERGR